MSLFDDAKQAIVGLGIPEDEAENVLEDMGVRDGDEEDDTCEFCDGTGEVDVMESVYAGEPHQAPTGTKKCICQLSDADDERIDEY